MECKPIKREDFDLVKDQGKLAFIFKKDAIILPELNPNSFQI